ncbi:glycosyl transferase [Porphyromonas macacae]|uniref:glycosyltransferase family 2 protein n=1 Tax=Porphyromonas macacae TaxID=28115 RepID=UPI00052D69AC|nr:glycosyltransferase family 2 protein [Porphyromonas macacae]KGN98576.1 glycosyl transferase [Porphyromonas macacae]
MNHPVISIIIPVYNEELFIENCLDSVLAQDYPMESLEVIVVNGNSSDKTKQIIHERYPKVIVLENPDKIVPISMNIGIKQSKGEYIVRLDAHSLYPNNYLRKLIEASIILKADNVGTVCLTDVRNKTLKGLAIKTVLGNRFGVGNSMFRTGVDRIKEVDTVPFGCFKKDVFQRFGFYNEHLIRNQDIELNKRIKQGGGKIYLIPDTYCIYFARDNYKSFARSNYGNGLWNILTIFYTKNCKALSLRHFIPLLFVCSLLIPTIIGVFIPSFFYITCFSFLTYLIFITFFSIKEKLDNTTLSIPHLIWAFTTLHFPYGWGSIIGLFKVLKLKLK